MYFVLIFFIGLYIGHRVPDWITKLVNGIEKRRVLRDIVPSLVDDSKLCNGPHTWFEAKSIDEKNEYIYINVCDTCGFIPGRNLMASQNGLKRIKENRKADDFDKRIVNDYMNLLENEIKEYFKEEIEKGLNVNKVIQVYNAGQRSREQFTLYKIARAEKEKGAMHE